MRHIAGAVRWWMPLVALLGGTAALVFAAWIGGVDMAAAGQRIADRLEETFHDSSWGIRDERGHLLVEFDPHDNLKRVTHDGRVLPPEEVLIEDGYITITSMHYDDGELMYWKIPLDHEGELREEVRNPRWFRTLMRVHPVPEGERAGLRVARLGEAAASKAGVEVGDVIVGVEDSRPATTAEIEAVLQRALADRAPGGPLRLLVVRDGEPLEIVIELEPLISRAEWESLDIEDPVERYLVLQQPWRHQDRNPSVQVEETDDAEVEPIAPPPPLEPPVQPAKP